LAALDLLAGGFRGSAQSGDRSVHAKIGLADTEIDWSRSALELYNLVRGQSAPYLNAWTTWAGDRLFVLSAARPASAFRAEPGQVIGPAEGGMAIGCGTPGQAGAGALILREVRAGSGPALPAWRLLAAGQARLGAS
jgi:methionyl-tRNA formyltransferase